MKRSDYEIIKEMLDRKYTMYKEIKYGPDKLRIAIILGNTHWAFDLDGSLLSLTTEPARAS